MPTHQPMRACHASVSAPSRSLELGSLVILARCPDRSVKKEEEMFLYLECGHFISRIYSRSNTRITSRCQETPGSLWSKTREVTGANIRRGLPKISLFLQSSRGRKAATASLSIHSPRTAGLSSHFSCIAEERAWLPQPNLLFPPTTGGQRCSPQLIFSRKSPRPSSSTNSS
ncbi:unnamed protein product [Pleuronectes platessa]|uniref:Uncharacterized protein n=1 Tax=Pleuronectes platessa TaxID=8262 RepID=A0A9N7V0M3_PLEPL|nr:unnamed protein product [Pleuronectes platessa]